MGGKCCAKKIFIFTTNKDIEIAIEKFLEGFVSFPFLPAAMMKTN